ncbi:MULTISPECIES: DUF5018 domain-containing protein [Niastella]|uniref:DUF5018 domain-containing protein n=1 Tax=Niastella soli TaxID=2821487 RepID=A0ABS3YMR0_9BACT|nr:DUF5018 domain-containing protein [Niastella soli]MBO9198730.1 DUF5018 domain-containing protein [Niastella soli]
MKNLLNYILITATAAAVASSCRKVDAVPRSNGNAISDMFVTLEGYGKDRLFEPRFSNDTIYFDVPFFYTEDSENATDIKRLIVRATIPTDAQLSPSIGEPMDLTNPVKLQVTSGEGAVSSYVLAARQVADTKLRKATITFTENGAKQQIDAIVNNATNEAIFYVVPGTNVSSVSIATTMSPHSKGSIADGTVLNLTQPVPFTVTGVDGSSRTYTLKAVEPVKLNYGVGISRMLWRKSAAELTGFATNDVNRAMAISGNYLAVVVSNTPSTYKIYNRKTGDYVQDMTVPPGSLRSFAIANDTAGHILVSSYAAKNGVFYIYQYNNAFDAAPVKLIQWTNNNPASIAGDGGVGRRVNVYGDVTKNAVIAATAGVSNVVYTWKISNGVLVSNTPTVQIYSSMTGTWSFYAEAQPTGTTGNPDYFINYPAEIALVNGSSNSRSVAFTTEASVVGTLHLAMDYFPFNNANFLAVSTFKNVNSTKAGLSLFDVTKASNIGLTSNAAGFNSFRVFASDDANDLTAASNGNGVADVCWVYNDDRERVCVYMMLTNGGIVGYEFTKYAP